MFVLCTLAELKKDFERDLLRNPRIEVGGLGAGYVVQFEAGSSSNRYIAEFAEARTKKTRVFKSIDSAANAIEAVGFRIGRLEVK